MTCTDSSPLSVQGGTCHMSFGITSDKVEDTLIYLKALGPADVSNEFLIYGGEKK